MPKHHQSRELAAVSAHTAHKTHHRPNIRNGQHPTPVLAIAAMRERLTLLQHAVQRPEHAELRQPQIDMSELCDTMERTVSDGVYKLAKTEDALQGLHDLLKKAHGTLIPAHRLASLLSPLLRQLHRAGKNIGQIL